MSDALKKSSKKKTEETTDRRNFVDTNHINNNFFLIGETKVEREERKSLLISLFSFSSLLIITLPCACYAVEYKALSLFPTL